MGCWVVQLCVQSESPMHPHDAQNLMENFSRRALYGALAGVVAALLTVILCVSFFRAYRSEVTILILPQNTVAAIEGDDVRKNMSALSQTERFATFLRKNGIDDEKIDITRGRKGNTIRVRYENDDRAKAIRGAQEAARTLLTTTSHYYNIKTAIDLRIIDGPLTHTRATAPLFFTILSLIIGVGTYFFVTRANTLLSFFTVVRTYSPRASRTVSVQEKQEIQDVAKKTPVIQKTMRPITPALKTAPAPTNLPIVGMTGKMTAAEFRAQQGDVPPTERKISDEPTEEELKERLNKLLRGDL